MADVKSLDAYYRFYNRVTLASTAGISWGTNNYPANSLVGWFGGTTAGSLGLPSVDAIEGPNDDLNAAALRTVFMQYANIYSRIRRTRVYITRSKSGYANNTASVLYDGTAIASLPAGDQFNLGALAAGGLNATLDVDQGQAYDYIERLRNLYIQRTRVSTLKTLSRQICHTQCHSSCHNSRGRR